MLRRRVKVRLASVVLALLTALVCCAVRAAPDAAAPRDAGTEAARPPADAGIPADLARLRELSGQIRSLSAGKLAPDVDPASLFEIPLDDETAVAVERKRLQGLLRVEAPAAVANPAKKETRRERRRPDAGAPTSDAGTFSASEQALWHARLDVDRARLAFLSLPRLERDALLEKHAKAAAKLQVQPSPAQGLSAAEQKAREAAQERQRALEDSKRAHSEAARLVAEERARLSGVREEQAKFEARLIRDQQALGKRSDEAVGCHQRVSDLIGRRKSASASAVEADAIYASLVKTVRGARADLGAALSALGSGKTDVPQAGPDRVAAVGVAVDRRELDRVRSDVLNQADRLEDLETSVRWKRATTLLDEVESLNRDRLALYPYLSGGRRDELTSLSPQGFDQARAEAWQVALIARYHAAIAIRWIVNLKTQRAFGAGGVFATLNVLKILALFAVFWWWRRRADALLGALRDRAREAARGSSKIGLRSWLVRGLGLLIRTRKPIEWLLLIWGALLVLGPTVQALYEAQLLWTVLGWTLGGMIVVDAIDEVFAGGRRSRLKKRARETNKVRLRSLRLIGRVTVFIGLTLSLTAQLVGKGTIYGWVLSVAWLIALPIVLVILRWWRPIIFEQIDDLKKKNTFSEWVVAHERGWSSLAAAGAGGVFLLGLGAVRVARGYVSGFNVTRRVLAYWFRREISKQAKERKAEHQRVPLGADRYATLDPEQLGDALIPGVAAQEVEEVIRCIDAPGGGVFAVVGERGSGKSTLLERIRRDRPDSRVVQCPPGGIAALLAALAQALGLSPDASEEQIKVRINARTEDNALLVDDAQRLVRPMIGGLDDFDRVLKLARESSSSCTWVFAVGSVIWSYVQRARGARPLFDDVIEMQPWSEEDIAELLKKRSLAAGIEPHFEDLIIDEESDPELHAEQLGRTEASYYRLLWDYAVGNPAVAIHFWRESLYVEPNGDVVVRLFSAPDTSDLERLPDSAVFVLRAIVQLELAAVDDIVETTMLAPREVNDAIRYALSRGYLEENQGRYRVVWSWFRAVTTFLQRRHLLAAPKH
jgi:AAA domain